MPLGESLQSNRKVASSASPQARLLVELEKSAKSSPSRFFECGSFAPLFPNKEFIMSFAVIKTGGKQYKVATGDVIAVEKIDGDAGGAIHFL